MKLGLFDSEEEPVFCPFFGVEEGVRVCVWGFKHLRYDARIKMMTKVFRRKCLRSLDLSKNDLYFQILYMN